MLYNSNIEAKLNELFDELVPEVGKADTLAGEIVRATSLIIYRYYNDGDRINDGMYGNEICNPAARFLLANGNRMVRDVINSLWNDEYCEYSDGVEDLAGTVVEMLERDDYYFTVPTADMYDYKTAEDMWVE